MSTVAGRRPVHVGGLSDEELVDLARGGHEPAFDAIVHRYRAPLVNYCRRWVDPHRAEEVVQHTLMKAFLCLRDDDRPLALRPWLYRVAHNSALNALEKKGSDWEQLDENYDGVPQPPQVAEQRARLRKVVCEIEELPARQREALLLNEFEGRCYADIATELGTSESGVRGLLRRARRQLRETAAALLLPFPALRELVRSDGGRALPVDRAGELIGSAGAAGGIGAAGGVAKLAAGVLAAGTIAGGGTAIEQRDGGWRAPEAEVAEAAELQPLAQPGARAAERWRTVLVASAGDEDNPVVTRRVALSGGQLGPAGGGPFSPGRQGGGLDGVERPAQEESAPAAPAPEPLVPAEPSLPVSNTPKEAPAEDGQPAGEVKEEEPKQSDPGNAPSGNEQTADSGSGDPTSPPASPAAPVQPQRLQR